jgi:hypothetical protein
MHEQQIDLVTAMGSVDLSHLGLESYLPFPKEQMNFVIAYDPNEPQMKILQEFLAKATPMIKEKKSCEGYSSGIPKINPAYGSVVASASGNRSAIIDKAHFYKRMVLDGQEIQGLKIKGCRVSTIPPFPIPFVPEKENGLLMPETYAAYREDGTEYKAFKDQPMGILVKHAKHELFMNAAVKYFKIPTNMIPLGVGSYDGVFYAGHLDFSKEIRPRQMGMGIFGLTGTDERVRDLTLNIDYGKKVSVDQAEIIFKNFQSLAELLETDLGNLCDEVIYRGSGKILDKLHSAGIIHGPRQSHYMNYAVPSKEDRSLKVCDFESAMLVKYLTDQQALRYMTDDLSSLFGAATELYAILLASIVELSSSRRMPDGYDAKKIFSSLAKVSPLESVLTSYTKDEYDRKKLLERVKERSNLGIIELVRKEELQKIRETWENTDRNMKLELSV